MRTTTVYWETKDGQTLELSEMTTSHIKNCIAMIEKSIKAEHPWRKEALPYLRAELRDRERAVNAELFDYDCYHGWDEED